MMNSQSFTVDDIRAGYSEKKRKEDREIRLWIYLIIRRISFYLSWVFLKLHISANQTTYLSITVGFIGCVFLSIGSHNSTIVGAILMNCWLLLDCVDGNIARCQKSSSDYGQFIDTLGGYVVSTLLFMSVGIGAFRGKDYIINWDKYIFMILGFWGSLSYILTKLISLKYKELLSHTSTIRIQQSNKMYKIIFMTLRNVYGVSGFFMPLLLLSAILNSLDLLIFFYVLVNTGALFLIVGWTVVNGRGR